MTTDDLLRQGIAALKAGSKTEAHRLLMQVVQQDERNEMAWLWLSGAVDTDEERRTCLNKVLAINANNGVARRGLESLISKEGVRSLSTVSSSAPSVERTVIPRGQPAQTSVPTRPPEATRRKQRETTPKRKKAAIRPAGLIVGLGAALTILALVVLAGIWWAIDSGLLPLGPAAPVAVEATQAVPIADATSTPVPTLTQLPTSTPLPTPVPRRAVDYTLQVEDLPSYYDIDRKGTGVVSGNWQDGYSTRFRNTNFDITVSDAPIDMIPSRLSQDPILRVESTVYVFETTDEALGQAAKMVSAVSNLDLASMSGDQTLARQVSVSHGYLPQKLHQ